MLCSRSCLFHIVGNFIECVNVKMKYKKIREKQQRAAQKIGGGRRRKPQKRQQIRMKNFLMSRHYNFKFVAQIIIKVCVWAEQHTQSYIYIRTSLRLAYKCHNNNFYPPTGKRGKSVSQLQKEYSLVLLFDCYLYPKELVFSSSHSAWRLII